MNIASLNEFFFYFENGISYRYIIYRIRHKGPSTNRFRPPIADLFRDGGRGLAFESAFKKKTRTKPQLVFKKNGQYKIQPLPI